MVTLAPSKDAIRMPELPAPIKEFIPYLTKNPDTPLAELLEPYKLFEAELRKVYAQKPESALVKDGKTNMVPVFDGHEEHLKIRARELHAESEEQKSKYIMPLTKENRKEAGSPAVVASLEQFKQNFNLFSESSLTELDWTNVVAAGSAVTTALLPVPEKWSESKRSLREYYHERLAPASDVDLFLYGLNEEEALKKIKEIERSIKDSILEETVIIRTKNAITIASKYPNRHVQIVLRLYDSISQILTGFDVDCACVAYDGKQVYAAPRALTSFLTQINTIDLTRRSPSYENRLSKYSKRGFEVHWPSMDRARIDPTIFERSFGRTQGLARLLILEKLPSSNDRNNYMDQRRQERGRPHVYHRTNYRMRGDIKQSEEDEVADWVDEEDVASYHTMTVPYGPKYAARKITRLLYAKDLLLNAEWNQQKDREVYLHRHPCFIGTAEEVLEDCCGYCPSPKTDEEIEIAEKESKTFVSGPIKFVTDDPGRQEIGSFNPITDDEWTTMAYVGDTARLSQAIVDGDLEHVEDWCSQGGVDVNRRDYTGRTPLHLAVMTSTPEVVKCLIDNGARLVARLVDGRTALHIAAARGNVDMVKAIMDKSLANAEAEEEKVDAQRAARRTERTSTGDHVQDVIDPNDDASTEGEMTDESEDDSDSMTMGSFVKVDKDKPSKEQDLVLEDSSEEPDIFDVDVVAWDYGLSALHYAILNAHLPVIHLLVSEYGADVLLPVKLFETGTTQPKGAIMTLLLAMALPSPTAEKVMQQLLELGATSAQGDMSRITAFHYIVAGNKNGAIDVLLESDRPAAMSVLNNVTSRGNSYNPVISTPLMTAIENGYAGMVSKLLGIGAKVNLEFDDWIKVHLAMNKWSKNNNSEINKNQYFQQVEPPIILAAGNNMGLAIEELLAQGADPNALGSIASLIVQNPGGYYNGVGESVLDIVQNKLRVLRKYEYSETDAKKPEDLHPEAFYTSGLTKGTYQYWSALKDFQEIARLNKTQREQYAKEAKENTNTGVKEKLEAVAELIMELEKAEQALISAGAKSFRELHPDAPKQNPDVFHQHNFNPIPKPYETKLDFLAPDLNESKRNGYIALFEAAWCNNFEKIKSLTLPTSALSTSPSTLPLKMAIQDSNGFSPYSIAVLRGHYDLARRIVEITMAQYHKTDGKGSQKKWSMAKSYYDYGDGCDYEDGYDSENERTDHQHLPISSELVSDKFTLDDLGAVSNEVKSEVLPLTMIEWECKPHRVSDTYESEICRKCTPFSYAIETDNVNLFKFTMQLGAKQQAFMADTETIPKAYQVGNVAFHDAIEYGRTTMLAEIIKATGSGLPLGDLIKKNSLEIKAKSKYYQGLSVGGKKRADWAQAPGGNQRAYENNAPLLLEAIKSGNIESVDWFMSDTPRRRYQDFAETNKSDKRIETLENSIGFENVVKKWLDSHSELAIHRAVLSTSIYHDLGPENLPMLKHVTSVMPELIEQKSVQGWTPLQVAILRGNKAAAEHLISVGANQRSRDKLGRNMLHSLMWRCHCRPAPTDSDILGFIELFDEGDIKEMLVERCNEQPGALTPLGYWMALNGENIKTTGIAGILGKYSTGEDLEMINGEGDLPLHVAVRHNMSKMTSFFLSQNPALLYRENATGRTPLEMARDIFTASQIKAPDLGIIQWQRYRSGAAEYNLITQSAPSTFVKKEVDAEGKDVMIEDSAAWTWEICDSLDKRMESEGKERKRRLVSLFEANEVAKRVVTAKRKYEVISGNGEPVIDFVSQWMW